MFSSSLKWCIVGKSILEVIAWLSNCIPHICVDVIEYPLAPSNDYIFSETSIMHIIQTIPGSLESREISFHLCMHPYQSRNSFEIIHEVRPCQCLALIKFAPLWRIYASVNWIPIGSDNGLSPDRRLAIIWTNAGILLIAHLRTNLSEIRIKTQKKSFMNIHLKMSSGKGSQFFEREMIYLSPGYRAS